MSLMKITKEKNKWGQGRGVCLDQENEGSDQIRFRICKTSRILGFEKRQLGSNELRLEVGHWGEDRAEHVGIVHIR